MSEIAFALGATFGGAVNAAARSEYEAADAALLRHLRQRNAGLFVDRFGDAFEFLPHRVVGNRREMDDDIDAIEQFRRKVSDIAEMHAIQQQLGQPGRSGKIVGKECSIEADQFGVWKFLPEVTRKNRADIAHRAGNKNTHGIFLLYHFFQGALLLDQRSSRYRLSRNVSIGCQNPSWRNTLSWPSSASFVIGSFSHTVASPSM